VVKFSAPVQTGPGAHPALLPGVKWPVRGDEYPISYIPEVNEKVELYLYSLSGPSWSVNRVKFTLI
jgi:hypothetical protein